MPGEVEECVRSIKQENPDMPEERAWAICHTEIDDESAEITTLPRLDVEAAVLDELATEGDEWASVEGGWINAEEQLAVYNPDALDLEGESGAEQQADGMAVDVFQVVQAEDDDRDLDGDLLGIGVDFPNADVYVDWRLEAFPEDEQLDDAHVSVYGSIADVEQATGGVIEPLDTVAAAVDADGAEHTEEQAVVVRGLSEEARESIATRYNVDIEAVVGGEASAAPADSD